ncbi:Uncharacterised protein [Vibrio cholerae]|nr:Uncharacterised protein [Vibrio cholerae]CSB23545.1 Uncharacterised protein [Vibrio cholerae]CSB57200.1 Uncharacterised protein [Vibrio cholerae]CSC18381.1 Uncharacterised protein [Vibrio cholerae]CSC98825.1 Uncharacterised protein [Vibrio cholerae]
MAWTCAFDRFGFNHSITNLQKTFWRNTQNCALWQTQKGGEGRLITFFQLQIRLPFTTSVVSLKTLREVDLVTVSRA